MQIHSLVAGLCFFAFQATAGNPDMPSAPTINEVKENVFYLQNPVQGIEALADEKGITLWKTNTKDAYCRIDILGLENGEEYLEDFSNPSQVEYSAEEVNFNFSSSTIQYLNNTQGIKQNIIINHAPLNRRGLKLHTEIQGSLQYEMGNDEIAFYTEENGIKTTVFKYSGLKVFDKTGKILAAKFVLNGNDLIFEIDDADAVYPIVIDPISTVYAWTAVGGKPGVNFGKYVVNAGDVYGDGYEDILISSDNYTNVSINEGRVSLFNITAAGIPSAPNWTSESNQDYAYYGTAIGGAGDVNGDGYDDIIIGSQRFNDQASDDGAAFLFYGSATGPGELPDWFVSGGIANTYKGKFVGGAGDINADGFDDVYVSENGVTPFAGKIKVYYGSIDGPSTTEGWSFTGPTPTDDFGYSATAVDINKDGYSDLISASENTGVIYAFYGSATGLPVSPSWSVSGSANLGKEISSAGDVNGDGYPDILISQPNASVGYPGIFSSNAGRAFLFYGSATGLVDTNFTSLAGDDQASTFSFDHSGVGDINGDGYDDVLMAQLKGDFGNTKRFLLYLGSAKGVLTHPSWFVDHVSPAGDALDIAALGDYNKDGYDDFIIGLGFQTVTYEYEGAAYVYNGQAQKFNTLEPDRIIAAGDSGDFNDAALGGTSAGDVNGDGYDDVLFVFPSHTEGGLTLRGKAGVIYGSSSGIISSTLDWSVLGTVSNENFGYTAAAAGDVNNDGYDDLLIGSPFLDATFIKEGKVSLYLGSATGPAATAAWSYYGGQEATRFGSTLCGSGDINGDGYDDVLISSPYYDGGLEDEGKVYVFYGNATGLNAAPGWTYESDKIYARLGFGVGPGGDVNSDGYADILCGAFEYANTPTKVGKAYAFYGGPSGLASTPSWTFNGTSANAALGSEIFTAGDVNGDGYGDILVGGEGTISAGVAAGKAYLFFGSASGLSASPGWSLAGKDYGEAFGRTARGIGDVNDDGYDDFMVVETNDGYGIMSSGVGYIFHGKPGMPSVLFTDMLSCSKFDSHFGANVQNLGDVNGDNKPDMLITDPGYFRESFDEHYGHHLLSGTGAVFLYYGGSGFCDTVEELSVAGITSSSANISWTSVAASYTVRWKKITDVTWNYTIASDETVSLLALSACSDYEVQVSSVCVSGTAGDYTISLHFTTTGCVDPCAAAPTGVSSTIISSVKAKISWDIVPGAIKYKIQYRPVGATSWTNLNAVPNFKTINSLTPGTTYNYRVRTICTAGMSPFSAIQSFTLPLREANYDDNILVFPVPANDVLYIQTSLPEECSAISLKIMDITGNIVYSNELSGKAMDFQQINVADFAAGNYIVSIHTSEGICNRKIIIQ